MGSWGSRCAWVRASAPYRAEWRCLLLCQWESEGHKGSRGCSGCDADDQTTLKLGRKRTNTSLTFSVPVPDGSVGTSSPLLSFTCPILARNEVSMVPAQYSSLNTILQPFPPLESLPCYQTCCLLKAYLLLRPARYHLF